MLPEYKSHIAVMGHAWTIGVEEKFYVFWPLILVAFGRHRPMMIAAALTFAFGFKPQILRGYLGLAFGAGLAIAAYGHEWVKAGLSKPVAFPALCAMGAAYAGSILVPHDWIWNVLVSFAGSVMIASLWFTKGQAVSRFLGLGLLPWLGRLTHAIYLLQSLCINVAERVLAKAGMGGFLLTFALAYAICVGAAWAAHVAVERPMILLGKKLSQRRRAKAAV